MPKKSTRRGISKNFGVREKEGKKNNLARIRIERGYTQEFLADRACLPANAIGKYERGDKDINKAQAVRLYRIARALRVPMEELLQKEKITQNAYKKHKTFWDKLWD